MAAAVTIDFKVGGIARVNEAFEGVSKRMTRMEQEALKEAEKAAAARERLIVKETQSKARELTSQQKSAEKTAAAIDRLNANSAKEANKILERRYREAEKYLNDDVIKTERSEAKKTAIAAREEASRTRTVDREAKARQTVAEKMARSRVGTIGNSISGMASTAMTMAGGALALGGGFAVADSMRNAFASQKTAAQIVNAVTTGGKAPDGATVANILKTAGVASIETGIDKDSIAKAGLAYARSARGGDFKGVMGNMGFFAKMAKTTNVDIGEIAGAAGKLQSQNPNLDAKGMQQMLLSAYAQSKMGTASLTQIAGQFGTLAGTRGFYQGSVADNQRKLLGLGQIAASGGETGDVGTYIKDLAIQGAEKRRKTVASAGLGGKGLESLGVKYNAQGQMESPEQMIGAVFKATKGDLGKIAGIFGSRGLPAFTELSGAFNSAGGGDKGVEAVKKAISDVTAASMTPQDLEDQFAQVMSTSAEKFNSAVNKIKEIIEEKISPYLDKFADMLSKPEFEANVRAMIDAVGAVAKFFMDNPFIGIGAAVLTKITADVGAAMIGDKIKDSLVQSIATNGSGITAANAVITVAAASLAIASFKAAGDVKDDASNAFDKGGDDSTAGVWGLTKKLNSGTATPQDIEAAKAKKADITKMLGDATADVNSPGYSNSSFRKGINATGEKLGNMVGIGGTERQDDAKARARNEGIVANAANVETALMNLDKALQKVAATAGTATDDNPARKHSMVSFQRGGVP